MKFTHAPNQALSALAYHDPVYDEEGGQGNAIQTMAPEQVQNPGALLLIVGIIALILLLGEENG